jgi:hypothetical protein
VARRGLSKHPRIPQTLSAGARLQIETNYRSVPEVLAVANAAIAANVRQFRKELVAAREGNDFKPALVPLGDSGQQAQFVAQRVLELHEEGVDLDEIAVLYRAHFHSMEIQMEFTRRGIPFQITSGMRFFEQAHIKDVASFLKYVVNPRDEVAFKRMVRLLPGIGPRAAENLWADVSKLSDESSFTALIDFKVPSKSRKSWEQLAHTLNEMAPKRQPVRPSEMLRSVVEAVYEDYAKANFPNYEQRREDLQTLVNFSRQYQSAAEFLDQLALLTNLEHESVASNEETDLVTLTSVHQAKGLEWKIVFVIWMADGKFPSVRSLETDESVEEERRLFYVAVTRAKDELYLTYPQLIWAAATARCFSARADFSRRCQSSSSRSGKWVAAGESMNPPIVPLDLSRLRVFPLAQRESLTRADDILVDPNSTPSPCSSALVDEIRGCANQIRAARRRGATVMLIYGAHLLRNGAALILERLMADGWLTHLATNGAGTIHDWEYAWFGASTESVEMNVERGQFGTWDETATNIHLALMTGVLDSLGYGRSLGRFICEDGARMPWRDELAASIAAEPANPLTAARADLLRAMKRQGWSGGGLQIEHRWKRASILAHAWRLGVPLTVHPGIGYDIISNHPIFNGAVIGRAAELDFKLFGGSVERLDGGVVSLRWLGDHGAPGIREEPELCEQPPPAVAP